MNWKLQLFILSFLVTSPLVAAIPYLIEGLGVASSITGLMDYSEGLLDKIFNNSYERANDALVAVQELNDDVQSYFEKTTHMLKSLPYIIDHMTKRNKLQEHVNNIGFAFKTAVEKKFNIKNNRREDKKAYENFRDQLELTIDKDIYEIYRMLLDNRTTSYLSTSLIAGVQLYDTVCASQMSQQQLLNDLLVKLKIATVEYRLTKDLMYEFLQFYSDDPHQYDVTKENLRRYSQANYNNAIRKFKPIIAAASQQIWRCDADKVTRYENKPGSPYYELKAFTKYVFNEGIFQHWISDDRPRCPEITKVDKCKSSHNDHGKYCQNTRKCPNNLIGCKNLHENHDQETYVCLNNDKSALSRYKSFVPKDELKQLACPGGTVEEMKDVRVGFGSASRHSSSTKSWHNFCGCLCEEKYYYISLGAEFTEHREQNKVVVGARLVIQVDTIHIQLRQATLKPNGAIDENTLEWLQLPSHTSTRIKITWDDMRSIDLTSGTFEKGYAIIGAGFEVYEKDNRKRIHLVTYVDKIDYSKGKILNGFENSNWPPSPKNELVLKNMDVPINSVKPNEVDSNDNQFLSFTLTSEKKDGAQTTIPFIDTQDVVTNPPVPLRGMGLIHRGQPGFGGFLALKIYTYNVADHIPDLPEQINIPDLAPKPKA